MRDTGKRTGCLVDLHLHSTYSDGQLTPAELVDFTHKAGLCAISVTDHDSVAGIEEAVSAGGTLGVEVISGVELSTSERGSDIHILGYLFDSTHVALVEYIEFFRQERIKRARRIVEKLHGLGCKISFADVMSKSGKGSVGRPHIAEVMVDRGFVKSLDEAFWLYLGDDKPAFVPKHKIRSAEAIRLIEAAGGLSFLAHPGNDTPGELVVDLIKQGLSGIETIHPKHGDREVQRYRQMVREYGLLETGGSDFHGPENRPVVGEYVLRYTAVEEMKTRVSHGLPAKSLGISARRTT